MKRFYCKNCKVSVKGHSTCPLCGAYVGESPDSTPEDSIDNSYPKVSKEIIIKHQIFRAAIFITIISLVAVFLTDWIVTKHIDWSLHVAVGWGIFWLTIGRSVFFHLQLRRQIVWDCMFACFLVLYVEYLIMHTFTGIGFRIVVPCIIAACIGGMGILMASKYKTWYEYALPTSVLCLLSVIPLIVSLSIFLEAYFMLYIIAALGILTQLAMMLFGHKCYFGELKKKFHV